MTGSGPLDGASAGLTIALIVRFLVELALLTGVGVLASQVAVGRWRLPALVLAVGLVATVWGVFLSPQAVVPVPWPIALGIEAILFVGTGIGLFRVKLGLPAAIGIAVWLIDRIALAVLSA